MSDDHTQIQGLEGLQAAQERSLQAQSLPQVPGYEVETRIGEGAYGEVWLAKDLKNPGRRVAIKFYTRRGGDWTLLAREVEKLNFLATDRYVVQVLDVGWGADPPYYVMEYMDNGSLAERLQAGPLPAAEAVALFRDVVVGVVSAHGRGVLHCDLKPANVLLGPDAKPRLADFGQSRLSHEDTPALGTLFYMAPEQADTRASPDARWDVYALGALLHCMLTGQPPHRDAPGADTLEQATLLEERLARYRKFLREAPRLRKHRKVAGVDRPLAELIDRCLAVNPARRFPNAQAILAALDARALRRARRPLLVMGALAPILLLLLMGYLIRTELLAAVDKSTGALIEEARVSNEFAAQAVAEKVAGKIDRRWRVLEQEAAGLGFQKMVLAARGKSLGSPEQRTLQERLEAMHEEHREVAADSWSVFDDQGTLLARSPHDPVIDKKFIGRRFPHRNFFNGVGDLDEKAPPPPPLTRAHRSNVFTSTITNTRRVGFSVPVWKGKATGPKEPRVGVLMMTVEVGGFMELRGKGGRSSNFMAILMDTRADSAGRQGAILEHPRLAELRKAKRPEEELQFFVSSPRLASDLWDHDYTDPVGAADPKYNARWLAASAPVVIEERPEARDTGWVVIVQERYDTAIGPVLELQSEMLRRGRWALGVAVIVVTGLWLFVLLVLNESTGSRFFRFLRRQAGLGGDSVASMKAGSLTASLPKRLLVNTGAKTVRDQSEQGGGR